MMGAQAAGECQEEGVPKNLAWANFIIVILIVSHSVDRRPLSLF
jgi:hypothetical protein